VVAVGGAGPAAAVAGPGGGGAGAAGAALRVARWMGSGGEAGRWLMPCRTAS